jgi:hypothetical protein
MYVYGMRILVLDSRAGDDTFFYHGDHYAVTRSPCIGDTNPTNASTANPIRSSEMISWTRLQHRNESSRKKDSCVVPTTLTKNSRHHYFIPWRDTKGIFNLRRQLSQSSSISFNISNQTSCNMFGKDDGFIFTSAVVIESFIPNTIHQTHTHTLWHLIQRVIVMVKEALTGNL